MQLLIAIIASEIMVSWDPMCAWQYLILVLAPRLTLLFLGGMYVPARFQPVIGTNTAPGKRLSGRPSDWPAPDYTYCGLEGSEYTSLWLLKFGV